MRDTKTDHRPPRVAAIVCALDEAPRIAAVLDVLARAAEIDQIVVVDDGSTDDTGSVVRGRFPDVTYLRNDRTLGKGASMARGAAATRAPVLCFCDADLTGLEADHIARIVGPVLSGAFPMFIGTCSHAMQRAISNWALNAGQRAVARRLWDAVPDFYKQGFRTETGLNLYCRYLAGGYGHVRLPYSQHIKERKYGFARGSCSRWRMNAQIVHATVRFFVVDLLSALSHKRIRSDA